MTPIDYEKTACFSGYRPEKFPFPFRESNPQYLRLKKDLLFAIQNACAQGYEDFYSGACYGFDILAGEAVLFLRDKLQSPIRLLCALPYENQAQLWSEPWRDRYFSMLERADRVTTLQTRYTRGCYHRRNAFMVERSSLLICYHNGQEGGTEDTIRCAERLGLDIWQLCPQEQRAYQPMASVTRLFG